MSFNFEKLNVWQEASALDLGFVSKSDFDRVYELLNKQAAKTVALKKSLR